MNGVVKVGEHRVTNRDVTLGLRDLMNGQLADITVVDPPWGEGNEKFWHTMLKKDDPETTITRVPHSEFLPSLLNLLYENSKNICFMEYGVRWQQEVIEHVQDSGFLHLGVTQCLYKAGGKTLPLDLHIMSKTPIDLPDEYMNSITGTIGFDGSRKALQPFAKEGGILFDPCCGLGGYAKLAKEFKMRFYGNEMNPKRFNETFNVLREA
jgi:hypothetical protein